MDELRKMIEAIGRAFEEFKAANDERLKAIEAKGSADPLLAEKVERINADLSQLGQMKNQLEGLETVLARAALPGGGITASEEEKARAEHRKAFASYFRKGIEAGLAELEVKAALTSSSDPDGGFTVPEELEATIDRVLATVSAMRGAATVRSIGTDTYKKLTSQGGSTSGWVGEQATRSETTAPTLAQIAINVKEVYAMPAATQTLLDDSAVDIEAWLADEVGIEFAEEEGQAFISGSGVEEPMGILSYSTVANASYAWGKLGYIATGEAAAFTDADKLIDLQHALKSGYRPGSAWMMADSIQAHVRKFKDGEGNYIWRPGLEPDAPDTLLGKPVLVDDNMNTISAGTYPIAYGNFARGYLIVDRIGIRVLRDPFSSKPYVLFYTTKRVGGGVVNYEAIKLLKVAAS